MEPSAETLQMRFNSHAKANGCCCCRGNGGHGVGLEFHEEPWVSYVTPKGSEMLLVPGMIFTIEPMINEGSPEFFVDEDNDWTVYTEDDGLSAQIEYMVLHHRRRSCRYDKIIFYYKKDRMANCHPILLLLLFILYF